MRISRLDCKCHWNWPHPLPNLKSASTRFRTPQTYAKQWQPIRTVDSNQNHSKRTKIQSKPLNPVKINWIRSKGDKTSPNHSNLFQTIRTNLKQANPMRTSRFYCKLYWNLPHTPPNLKSASTRFRTPTINAKPWQSITTADSNQNHSKRAQIQPKHSKPIRKTWIRSKGGNTSPNHSNLSQTIRIN